MKDPCKMCLYHKETQINEFRKTTGCSDEEQRRGFHYDNFMYWHTCDNQSLKEECKTCLHNTGTYCNSVMGFVNGKCIDCQSK